MKKLVLIIVAVLTIGTSACNKENNQPVRKSFWTINGIKREVQIGIWQTINNEAQLAIQDKDGNVLRLTFLQRPSTESALTLIPFDNTLTGAKFKLETIGSYGSLIYKGEPVNISRTTDAEGTQLNIPEITLRSTTATDSEAKFSATLFL